LLASFVRLATETDKEKGSGIPPRELVDEGSDNRSCRRAQKRRKGEDHHGKLDVLGLKKIGDRARRDSEERATGKAIEESAHNHGLNVLRDGAGNEPDEEEEQGADVDWPAAVEL
jgi:hypothetical protein